MRCTQILFTVNRGNVQCIDRPSNFIENPKRQETPKQFKWNLYPSAMEGNRRTLWTNRENGFGNELTPFTNSAGKEHGRDFDDWLKPEYCRPRSSIHVTCQRP
jgi:hypothetical protein